MGHEDSLVEHAAAIQRLAASRGPLADARQRLLEAAAIVAGERVVEVGCGVFPGAPELIRRTGPDGLVVGLDASFRLLRAARASSASSRWPAPDAAGSRAEGSLPRAAASSGEPVVGRIAGDAHALPVTAESLDVVLLDKVLAHLERPRAALAEARRVLCPGGRLAAFEWDLLGIRVDSDDPTFDAALAAVQRATTSSPEAPAQLEDWLRDAGWAQIRSVPVSIESRRLDPLWRAIVDADLDAARRLGLASGAEVRRWWEILEARDRGGEFRAETGGVIVVARRAD